MLLSIDTSTAQSGLALYDGAQVLAELLWHSRAHHTRELALALAGLMERTGAKMDQVKAVGVALARELPIVGIPTLDIVAAAQPIAKVKLAVVLQAGRGRLALGRYEWSKNGWQPKGAPAVTRWTTWWSPSWSRCWYAGIDRGRTPAYPQKQECAAGLTRGLCPPTGHPGRTGLETLAGRQNG